MTNKITLIGDVHGKINDYLRIVNTLPEGRRSIQIGDMGVGFRNVFLPNLEEKHRWFRGNHDCPVECRAHPNYLGDYGFDEANSIFWVAGAVSIDKKYRVPGISWWEDEELSPEELRCVVDLYVESRPKRVLSHEAPSKVAEQLLRDLQGPYFAAKGGCPNSRTAQALQVMLEVWAPIEWVFGHYHVNKSIEWGCTKFTCVGELTQYELEIS